MGLPSPDSPNAGPSGSKLTDWFAREVLPHETLLRSWLRGRFSQVRDLDDVIQESYLRVMRARAAGHIEHAKAYLFNTARNVAIDRIRREKVVCFEPLTDSEGSFVLEEENDSHALAATQSELEMLTDAIRTLPERCREVLLLRKFHGLSHEEIATRLGITRCTVNAHITTAMLRVRTYFRDRGHLPRHTHER